jgi:hypothetical protein
MMTKAIPLASEIAGAHALDDGCRNRLCDWMIAAIQKFKTTKSSGVKRSAMSDPDNPFGEGKPPAPVMSLPTPAPKQPEPQRQVGGKPLTSDDIFGPSATGTDIFGTPTVDVFGTRAAKSTPKPAVDVFAQPVAKPPAPAPASKPSLDVFAPPTSKPSSDVFASTLDVFGQPTPSASTRGTGLGDLFAAPRTTGTEVFTSTRRTDGLGANTGGPGAFGAQGTTTAQFAAMAFAQTPQQNQNAGWGAGGPQTGQPARGQRPPTANRQQGGVDDLLSLF